jgi:hypothetical protein
MYEMRSRSLGTERLGTGTLTPLIDTVIYIQHYLKQTKTQITQYFVFSKIKSVSLSKEFDQLS